MKVVAQRIVRVSALAVGVLLAAQPAAVLAAEAKAAASATVLGPAVSVFVADRTEVVEQIVITGTLVPREEVLVTPEIDGLGVSDILVEVGDHVDKGQALARLNRDTLDVQIAQYDAQLAQVDASKAQAEAQLAQAKANRLQASRALDRTQTLNSKGFATSASLDQVQASAEVNDALVESAAKAIDVSLANRKATMAQRDQVTWKIGRTDVRAPTAGIVSQRNIRLGQVGSMAGGPMFRIIEDGDIELEADVPDISMPRIHVGMPVNVRPAGVTEAIQGTIRLISPEIDKTTRIGHVRIALKHDERLRIGASASGAIEIGRSTGVTLPLSAVSYDNDGAYVQLVKDDIVHTKRVVVGLLGGQITEIKEGVAKGDQVIARAGTFVRDGDRVRPVQKAVEEVSQ